MGTNSEIDFPCLPNWYVRLSNDLQFASFLSTSVGMRIRVACFSIFGPTFSANS